MQAGGIKQAYTGVLLKMNALYLYVYFCRFQQHRRC